MADLTINPNTIVVKTAAQWAVDPNVYNARQRLVTSDEFWGSTDQRKEKVADGVQTWAQLDYPPFATESYVDAGLSGKQPLDSDLTAIAGLTPSNDDIIQRKAGAWINRTMAQLWADLQSLAKTYFDTLYASKPIKKILTGNQTTTLDTQVEITDLTVTLEANTTYIVTGYLHAGCNNTGGVMFASSVPAGATFTISLLANLAAVNAFVTRQMSVDLTDTAAVFTVNNVTIGAVVSGTITTTNAGTYKLLFHSTTAGQTSTIYQLGSWMRFEKST